MKLLDILGSFLFLSNIILVVFTLSSDDAHFSSFTSCSDDCRFTLVESTPVDLTYPSGSPSHLSTYDAHKRLLSLASKFVHLSSFYWTLRGNDISYHDNSSYQGEDILNKLDQIAKSNSIDLKIAQNVTNSDTDLLAKNGAKVRTLDFDKLLHAGVLHTKMWIVDNAHMYVGSANFDWRSYTQVKELGILIENCSCLVTDVAKIFEVYWYLGEPNASIPPTWPKAYSTNINEKNPVSVNYNDTKGLVYFSSSPPPFCPDGRTGDIDAILDVINAAKKFIYISVMDYVPLFLYTKPKRFWPVIDDALRKVAYNKNVKVKLLAGRWEHTYPDMYKFLKSLEELNYLKDGKVDLQVRLFTVPAFTPSQKKIPFSRVCHDKYMVTDQHAYVGTSNWSGDYFTSTGGIGFILNQPKLNLTSSDGADFRQQLENVFLRDWSSKYSKPAY